MTEGVADRTGGEARRGDVPLPFAFFTEIGILHQLGTALLSATLPEGLHPSHFAILNHLTNRGDGRTPVDIARAMQVTKNTMTHSLKVLEGRGLIDVLPNPNDGRGKLVNLTEAGATLRNVAIADLMAHFGSLVGPTESAAMARVLDDLRLLRAHFDDNRPGQS